MALTGDLINLDKLVLTDTFNTWYNRTNQIIDSINPLQVYEVNVGIGSTSVDTGGGLSKYTSEAAGNYNGVVTLGVNPGPGIMYESLSGESRTVVDFRYFDDYGRVVSGGGTAGAITRVAASDAYIVNDASDNSSGPEGTAKKVLAKHMLPPLLDMGGAPLTISGDVVILGNLSTFGAQDFIAGNNLRIEDKQIELAYQQAISLQVTGVNSTSFPLTGGITAYYFTDSTSLTSYFYGFLQSFTGPAAGPTGTVVIGSIFGSVTQRNAGFGPEDFGATGYISSSLVGSPRYLYTDNLGITSSFLNNVNLDEGGIVLKGSETDKTWLWIWTDNDTGTVYNSWISNSNIGVEGNTNAVISRVYRSFGYTGVNQSQFIFSAESGKNSEIYLTESQNSTAPLTFTGGSWKIERRSSDKYLVFSAGPTGIESVTGNFYITPGASGTTYPNVPVKNWAVDLNSDLLDGAHATTQAAPYSIIITDASGVINPNAINAESIRRRYVQANHGLTFGRAVRVNPSAGGITTAYASSEIFAESFGIVSGIHSANEFTVTHQGRIDGISGALMTLEAQPFVPGEVYFLGASASSKGKLIRNVENLSIGDIRKPMLLALSVTQGYVMDLPGAKIEAPSDFVYLEGAVPVGTIVPYGGNISSLPSGWLVCDGDRYSATEYSQLYGIIGNTYSGRIKFDTTGSTGKMIGGTRRIQSGDRMILTKEGTTTPEFSVTVSSVNANTGSITFQSPFFIQTTQIGTYVAKPTFDSNNNIIFFVPDLRSRFTIGGTTGDTYYNSVELTDLSLGDIGGSLTAYIDSLGLPPHIHAQTRARALLDTTNTGQLFVTNVGATGTAQTGGAFNTTPPYLVINYVIRAKNSYAATILTGHNHDTIYHPLNGDMYLTGSSDNPFSEAIPSNAFNVIAVTGMAGTGKPIRTVLSVFADPTPLQQGGAQTEVHVRGDFSVYANGLTSVGFTTQGRYGESFIVRSNISTVNIIGGTGTDLTLTRPAPVLAFLNGMTSGPAIGVITGLTGPTADHGAANKRYADRADKIVGNTKSGGFYDEWRVTYDSSVPLPTRNNGDQGRTIFLTRWDAGNAITREQSQLQSYVYGDLSVFGDGLTSFAAGGNKTGHNRVTFAVDPMVSEVSIHGSMSTNQGQYQPTLSFMNSENGTWTSNIGRIRGVTFPVEHHEVANKLYVDNKFVAINVTGVSGFHLLNNDILVTGQSNQSLGEVQASFTKSWVVKHPKVAGLNTRSYDPMLYPSNPGVAPSADAMYRARWDLGNVVSPRDSVLQHFFYGDITVLDDGFPHSAGNPTPHNSISFAIDPRTSTVTIEGTPTDVKPFPRLNFLNSSDPATPIGRIFGLNTIGQGDEAVSVDYLNSRLAGLTGSGGSITVTGGTGFHRLNDNMQIKRLELNRNQAAGITTWYGEWYVAHRPGLTNLDRDPFSAGTGITAVFKSSYYTSLNYWNNQPSNIIPSYDEDHWKSKVRNEGWGDFIVYGDGTSGSFTYNLDGGYQFTSSNLTGHVSKTFEINPVLSQVVIYGGTKNAAGQAGVHPGRVVNPKIIFSGVDGSIADLYRDNMDSYGEVNGLTAPTYNHQAVNKWYLNKRINDLTLTVNNLFSSITLPGATAPLSEEILSTVRTEISGATALVHNIAGPTAGVMVKLARNIGTSGKVGRNMFVYWSIFTPQVISGPAGWTSLEISALPIRSTATGLYIPHTTSTAKSISEIPPPNSRDYDLKTPQAQLQNIINKFDLHPRNIQTSFVTDRDMESSGPVDIYLPMYETSPKGVSFPGNRTIPYANSLRITLQSDVTKPRSIRLTRENFPAYQEFDASHYFAWVRDYLGINQPGASPSTPYSVGGYIPVIMPQAYQNRGNPSETPWIKSINIPLLHMRQNKNADYYPYDSSGDEIYFSHYDIAIRRQGDNIIINKVHQSTGNWSGTWQQGRMPVFRSGSSLASYFGSAAELTNMGNNISPYSRYEISQQGGDGPMKIQVYPVNGFPMQFKFLRGV